MPFTVAPSVSVPITASLSAPEDCSITAFLETTTLFLFLSILITLRSHSLFSNGVVSLTGLTSTSEPGRNAVIPFTETLKPPLTRLLTKPLTTVPSFIASSRSSHACIFFALSLERIVEPKPSSNFSIATLTKSPTLTSSSPWSLRNSSALITLSDLSPAFTITKSLSIDITSAVITSPERIS